MKWLRASAADVWKCGSCNAKIPAGGVYARFERIVGVARVRCASCTGEPPPPPDQIEYDESEPPRVRHQRSMGFGGERERFVSTETLARRYGTHVERRRGKR